MHLLQVYYQRSKCLALESKWSKFINHYSYRMREAPLFCFVKNATITTQVAFSTMEAQIWNKRNYYGFWNNLLL